MEKKYKFPFDINLLDSETNDELLKYFHGEKTGYVQVGPEKYFFPYKYKDEAESYYNFEARPDDIWIATFPRSGTTFMQELVWLVANNLDFESAKNRPLNQRFPFFEFPLFIHPFLKEQLLKENSNSTEKCNFIKEIETPGYIALNRIPTDKRRFIKTHFPFSLLPPSIMKKQCKIICVLRDPKDVAVSYYHLNRLFRTQGFTGDFRRYWSYFERGFNAWMPYYSHLKETLAHQHYPNVLILKYSDMLSNLHDVIIKVAQFLDCKIEAEGLENLINHLDITNFRVNKQVNGQELIDIGMLNVGEEGFIRVGGRNTSKEFDNDPELLARANEWIEKNKIDFSL